MNTLLVSLDPEQLPAAARERIAQIVPDMRLLLTREWEEIEPALEQIEIAAGWMPRERIFKMPRLRWFQQWGAGADWLMEHPRAVDAEWQLTNTAGIHAIQISEHIFAMLLALARRLPEAMARQAAGEWWSAPGESLFELAGSEMLLIGVGAIGARTARLADAFGMTVRGIRRDPSRSVEGVRTMHPPEALHDLLPTSDFLVLAAPYTHETHHLIGMSELALMKEDATLVNVGRGAIVDEAALIEALQQGRIGGAALDVFEEEPLPDDSPFWSLDNVLITGHYSGATPHYHARALEIFLDNLERYRAGRPLRNLVDKALGY